MNLCLEYKHHKKYEVLSLTLSTLYSEEERSFLFIWVLACFHSHDQRSKKRVKIYQEGEKLPGKPKIQGKTSSPKFTWSKLV